MSDKTDLAVQEGAKQTGRFLIPVGFAVAGMVLFYMLFGDELQAFFDSQADQKRVQEKVQALDIANDEYDQRLDNIELTLIDLKDFKGDTTDLIKQLQKEVDTNTNSRIKQVGRATNRIKDHEFRDYRLDKHDERLDSHEDIIDEYFPRSPAQ